MNHMLEMRERMVKSLGALLAHQNESTITALAEWLLHEGVLFPPVKIGQTVYAVVSEEIEEWVVRGVTYYDGKWYARDDQSQDEFLVGDRLCFLTYEEAKQKLHR